MLNMNFLLNSFNSSRKQLIQIKSNKLYEFLALSQITHKKFSTARILNNKNSSQYGFSFDVNKYNDIHIKLEHIRNFVQISNSNLEIFETVLIESLERWRSEKRSSVWFYLPIEYSNLASILGKFNFKFHHAENSVCVLSKWLLNEDQSKSKIPMFATHQMGVAGVCYRGPSAENNFKKQLLCIKDRHMAKNVWKFPGGAADLGENIQDTAVREVREETGIKSEFCSVIGFRQQHNYPGAHGRSDLYIVCRLNPLTYEINACKEEINMCEWLELDFLIQYNENNLTKLIAQLVKNSIEKYGNFDPIDIKPKEMNSIYKGRKYNFFFRNLNELD